MGSGPPSPSAKPSLLETQGLAEPHEDANSARWLVPLSGCLEPRVLRPLAADGHLRAGAPHSRSRVGRRHTAATQALEADPACLGRYLSWTCAHRSTQGHHPMHHGYQRRSRTSTFSTHTSHAANQCRYGLQVLCYASVWSGPCLLACRGMLTARGPLGRPPAGCGGVF